MFTYKIVYLNEKLQPAYCLSRSPQWKNKESINEDDFLDWLLIQHDIQVHLKVLQDKTKDWINHKTIQQSIWYLMNKLCYKDNGLRQGVSYRYYGGTF